MRMRFNEKSWSTKVKAMLEIGEDKFKGDLKNVAEVIANRSPVDTGAYAESHSVTFSSGGGTRSRSSHGRPRRQSVEQFRGIAYQQMSADIEGLDLLNNLNTSVKFTNRAPHAQVVENKYQVYGVAKDTKK